jgi:peroxin-5
MYQRPPMYGSNFGGFGMQRPMMFQNQFMQQQEPQYEGKGKGRIQELSDTDWEKQFEALSTEDKEAEMEALDREAEKAMEGELDEMDRSVLHSSSSIVVASWTAW